MYVQNSATVLYRLVRVLHDKCFMIISFSQLIRFVFERIFNVFWIGSILWHAKAEFWIETFERLHGTSASYRSIFVLENTVERKAAGYFLKDDNSLAFYLIFILLNRILNLENRKKIRRIFLKRWQQLSVLLGLFCGTYYEANRLFDRSVYVHVYNPIFCDLSLILGRPPPVFPVSYLSVYKNTVSYLLLVRRKLPLIPRNTQKGANRRAQA
jgi:hypothetical protein